MSTPTTPRRQLLHLRHAGASYLVSWDLHPSQPPLTDAERSMTLDTLQHFNGTHFDLVAALVMEDKVYVLVTPSSSRPLERTVGVWKRWVSGQLGAGGRTAPFWRRGYKDRIMRDPAEGDQQIRQLKDAPGRCWPGMEVCAWLWVRGEGPSADDRPVVQDRDGGTSVGMDRR